MPRLIALSLAAGGLVWLTRGNEPPRGWATGIDLGFLLLGAYTLGELAARIGSPRIVGYLVAGMVFGPFGLGVVAQADLDRLAPVSTLAIALIAFLAGAELHWRDLRDSSTGLVRITVAELAVSLTTLVLTLFIAREHVPFLSTLPAPQATAMALLFASVAIVHSPAVTIALLGETGARGPIARSTLGIVLISDVAVVLLFSLALALAVELAPPADAALAPGLGSAVAGIGGSLVIGGSLGAILARCIRWSPRYLLAVALVAVVGAVALATLLDLGVLLTLLTAGFVSANLATPPSRGSLVRAMERSASPVFIVFFTISGAGIALGNLALLLPLVLPIALVRGLGIFAGVRLGLRWTALDPASGRFISMGLISQAGVAIALATTLGDAYPELRPSMVALLFSLIAVNEIVGPVLFRHALFATGEAAPPGPYRSKPEA